MKYVIVEDLSTGLELPIIFNEIFDHIRMVPEGCKAISAGTVSFDYDGEKVIVNPYGMSRTLDLKYRPTVDQGILQKTLDKY